jgi:hypothetical protein
VRVVDHYKFGTSLRRAISSATFSAPGEFDLLASRATAAAEGNEGKLVPSKKGAAIKRRALLSGEGGNSPRRDGIGLGEWMIGNDTIPIP